MTKEEVKAEIAKLEQDAAQLVANANVISGAKQAYQFVLAKMEEAEKAVGAALVSEGEKLET